MFQSIYTKTEPKVLTNRCFKNFSEQSFLQDFKQRLTNTGNFIDFNNEFKNILNDHTPIKTPKIHGNTKPHVNEMIKKEIMKRYNLKKHIKHNQKIRQN